MAPINVTPWAFHTGTAAGAVMKLKKASAFSEALLSAAIPPEKSTLAP